MRILNRKDYFYLQHSYRKGTKIITKEIYLGKKIPKNIEEIKTKFKNEIQKELTKKLKSIKTNFQKNWSKLPPSAKQREIEELAINFTYNTNAIEGSTITEEEARIIIQDGISPNKPIREVKETEHHSKSFQDILKNKEKISNKLLLEWHKNIFNETKPDIAGVFRTYLVRVGNYIAPEPKDIKSLMTSLIKSIENKKINTVELSAKIHYRFEKIHPFGDGNGRIGRLLMNHILWHSGYPILIIEYKKRKSYYKALQKKEEDFVKYFIRRYLSVHKKLLN
ncbi:MAG: Fic family protein [Nanoarchaeota archaeon]|nr:Fic family protein [Nanoarchaeota archaeon]